MAEERQELPFMQQPGLPGLASNGVALLSLLFGGSKAPKFKNPAQSGMPFLNQLNPTLQQYFNPYIQKGQEAGGPLQQQFMNLINNPADLMKNIGAGYKESPGFQNRLAQGTQAASNAALAGGMSGSPMHQQQAAGIAENIANEDYNNYMNQALGLYGTGLSGLGGLYNTGAQAGMGLGENLAQALMSQAQMAYGGQGQQNMMDMMRYMQDQQRQGGIAGLLGNLFGAGASFIPGLKLFG